MKTRKNKTKWKYGVLAIVFSLAFVAPDVFQFVDFGTVEKNQPISWFNPRLSDFFYDDTIDETTYDFNAHNESYIVCKIQNTAYSNFTLDGTIYNVSYGMNYIPINFGNENKTYTVTFDSDDISADVYDWFVVEPVIIDEGFIDINPDTPTSITFDAAGSVAFLVYWECNSFNNFTYDELYIEYDSVVINAIETEWDHEHEIDPLMISMFRSHGSYIEYSINMEPGSHEIEMKGNATIDYKLVVNEDWDRDGFSDVEEIQRSVREINSDYDLYIPLIYGKFLSGSGYSVISDFELESGAYLISIPTYYNEQYLKIQIDSGAIEDIVIDNDEFTFKDLVIDTVLSDPSEILYYGRLTPGVHYVSYKYSKTCVVLINFFLNGTKIFTIDDGSSDSDSDGFSDEQEKTIQTDKYDIDTDDDGLIDGYDTSPLDKMSLNTSKITEFSFSTNKSRDTLVTISISPFVNDYTTKETMIWQDMEVMVLPCLRVFGGPSRSYNDLYDLYGKEIESYDTNSMYGDQLPNGYNASIVDDFIIRPQSVNRSISYNLIYTSNNSAKDDSNIILRFDFIWAIFSLEQENAKIIHFYEIDEPVILQSFNVREISPMNYILGSPDSMIENNMLWNLVSNPNLGSFSDFGISDDVVGFGSANYTDLINVLKDLRESNPISVDESGKIDETEVVYFSYLFSDYDLLKNVTNHISWTKLSEQKEKNSWKEYFATNYIETPVSEDKLLDTEFIMSSSENIRICYQMSYNNYSTGVSSLEKRYNIIHYPIYMNNISFQDGDVLEETFVAGSGIPITNFPNTIESEIHDKITFDNYTTIENKEIDSNPMDITYSEYDRTKHIFDSRILEVPYSDLIFNEYSIAYIDIILRTLDVNPYYGKVPIISFLTDLMPNGWNLPEAFDSMIEFLSEYSYQTNLLIYLYVEMIKNIAIDWTMDGNIWNGVFRIHDFAGIERYYGQGGYLTDIVNDIFVSPPVYGQEMISISHSFEEVLDWVLNMRFEIYKDKELFYWSNIWKDLVARGLADAHDQTHLIVKYMDLIQTSHDSWTGMQKQTVLEMIKQLQKQAPKDTSLMGTWKWDKTKGIEMILDKFQAHVGDEFDKLRNKRTDQILEQIKLGHWADPPNENGINFAQFFPDEYAEHLDGLAGNFLDELSEEEAMNKAFFHYGREISNEFQRSASDVQEVDGYIHWKKNGFRPVYINDELMSDWYLNSHKKGKIGQSIGMAGAAIVSVIIMWSAIADVQAANDYLDAGGDIGEYSYRLTFGITKFVLGAATGMTIFIEYLQKTFYTVGKLDDYLTTLFKVSGAIMNVANIIFEYFIWQENWVKIQQSSMSEIHKIIWYVVITTMFIVEGGLSIAAFGILVGFITGALWTKWIPILNVIVFLGEILLLGILLFMSIPTTVDDPRSADSESSNTSIKFQEDKLRNKRSFEIGDEIGFYNEIESTGTETTYVQSRININNEGWTDYDGEWETGYTTGQEDTINPTTVLTSTNSSTYLEIEYEIAYWDGDSKETTWSEISPILLDIPILNENIEYFFGNLTENPYRSDQRPYADIIREFNTVKETLEFKQQSDLSEKLSNDLTYDFLGESGIPTDWYEQQNDENEFVDILRPDDTFYSSWTESPSTSDPHENVDEYLLYDTPTGEGDYVENGNTGSYDIYEVGSPIVECERVQEIKLYVYGYGDAELLLPSWVGSDTHAAWRWNSSSAWNQFEIFEDLAFLTWETNTWSNLDEPNNLEDLQIRLYCSYDHGVCVDQVRAIYVEATYESNANDPTPVLISEYKGHNDVMDIPVLGEYGSTEFYDPVSRTSGTLDFWLCKDNYTNVEVEKFIQIDRTGSIFNFDETSVIRQRPIIIDRWTHFSIDFDLDSFDLYVNGIQCGNDIAKPSETITSIKFIAFNSFDTLDVSKGNTTHVYIDAIDYSWDANWYQWRSFAWDYSQANITYYTNVYNNLPFYTSVSTDLSEYVTEMSTSTHIADFDFEFIRDGTETNTVDILLYNIPEGFTINDATHEQSLTSTVNFEIEDTEDYEYAGIYYFDMNVTLDSTGDLICYERIPFKIPYVEDLNFEQQNVIYENNDIRNGNYTSLNSFAYDTDGGNPSGWTVYESGGTVNVIASLDGHDKVIELDDTSESLSVTIQNQFTEISGSIEFWYYTDAIIGQEIELFGFAPGTYPVQMAHSNGYLRYHDGISWNSITPLGVDTWYRIQIDFDCDLDKFDVYIDDILVGYNLDFKDKTSTHVDMFQIQTMNSGIAKIYIDAVGYSWDTDYILEDNKYETNILIEDITESQVAKGDFVNVEFRTNMYAEVQMSFVNNDVVQETYTILPRGNAHYSRQWKSFIVNESITFDEIQFTEFKYNYFDISRILITDSLGSVDSLYNPVNITNNGNAPEYVQFAISGIDAEDVYATSSPGTVTNDDRGSPINWLDIENVKFQNDAYASNEIDIDGGGTPGDSTLNPGTMTNVDRDGKGFWSNPAYSATSNNQYASTYFSAVTYSDWLRVTNFGFNIPEDATIDGIKVRIEKDASKSNRIRDSSLRLRKTSGQVGDDKADTSSAWSTSDTYIEYGGSTDTWNAGLTYSDINSGDFGIDFSAQTSSKRQTAKVDHIEITIYYTVPEESETESDYLKMTDFNFADSIPKDAIITGVIVEIDEFASVATTIKDYELRLLKPNGEVSSDKKSSEYWGTTNDNSYEIFGLYNDTWNLDLSYNDIVNENFGVEIAVKNFGESSIAYIDHVRVKVYYGNSFVTEILPGKTIEMNFTVEQPTESFNNLIYREITYRHLGSNDYRYIDNFEIDGIYIASPLNATYNLIGNNLSCNKNELRLEIIPEVVLSSMNYSLDEGAQVSFSDNSVNVPLPEIEGTHTIQVFGEGSGPTYYESEIKNFTVKYPIQIFSPNKTENTMFHEFSKVIDSFDSNIVNSEPENWTIVDSDETDDIIYITGGTFTYGSIAGTVSNAQKDDLNYFTINPSQGPGGLYYVDCDFVFNTAPSGRDSLISYDMNSSASITMYLNGDSWKVANHHDDDDVFEEDVSTFRIYSVSVASFTIKIYYFKIVDQLDEGSVEVIESMNAQHVPIQISNADYDTENSMERDFPEGYETGNVSFSILRESITDKNTVLITLTGTSGTMVYALENDDLYYGTYATKTSLVEDVLKQDVWQTFVIFFNVSEGCQLFVDGVNTTNEGVYSPFSTGTPTDIDAFKIETVYHSGESYSFWFDNYLVNEIEGGFMLDIHYQITSLNDLQYSFDEGTKKSFTDRELFSFPEDGEHNITIYGTDFYGDEYRSEFKIFATGATYRIISNTEFHTPSQWSDFDFTKGAGTFALDIENNNGVWSTLTSLGTELYPTSVPSQWPDFDFTKGTGNVPASITTNNGVENLMLSGSTVTYGSQTWLGDIVPNQDTGTTNWNEGNAPGDHYNDLDESTPDGYYIKETSWEVHDRWNFDSLTLPENSHVTKMIVSGYVWRQNDDISNYVSLTSNCFGGFQYWSPRQIAAWKYRTITGLYLDQAQLNAFYLDVHIDENEPPNGWAAIDTVYVEVWYTPDPITTYSFDYEVTWTIPEGMPLILNYDYATSYAVTCDMDIYDYTAGNWNTNLKSETTTDFVTGIYDLELNPSKVSGSNEVSVRFQTTSHSSTFAMEIDQLAVVYAEPVTDYSLNYEVLWTISSADDILLYYDYRTSYALDCDMDIYDWIGDDFDKELQSNSGTGWITDTFDLTSDGGIYISGSNEVKIRFQTAEASVQFVKYIDQLTVKCITYNDL